MQRLFLCKTVVCQLEIVKFKKMFVFLLILLGIDRCNKLETMIRGIFRT